MAVGRLVARSEMFIDGEYFEMVDDGQGGDAPRRLTLGGPMTPADYEAKVAAIVTEVRAFHPCFGLFEALVRLTPSAPEVPPIVEEIRVRHARFAEWEAIVRRQCPDLRTEYDVAVTVCLFAVLLGDRLGHSEAELDALWALEKEDDEDDSDPDDGDPDDGAGGDR